MTRPALARNLGWLAAGALALVLAALLWTGGIRFNAPESAPTRAGAEAGEGSAVAARIGDRILTETELDDAIRLRLHDLEQARYELRAERLRQLIDEATAGETGAPAQVEILLAPPEPPVVPIGAEGAPVRGSAAAPVTIVEFLDFQSPYCRRMQPILLRILDAYPDRVRLAVRDFPLPFHRDARLAAEAAACAREQGTYWPYHDVLLQEQAQLGRVDLERYADRVGLDRERFTSCLASGRSAGRVAADGETARRLGLGVAPTFFVNGRYLKGPQSYRELEAAVRRELARLDLPTEPLSAPGDPPAAVPGARPDPDVVLTLRRDELRAALADRGRLEGQIEAGARGSDERQPVKLVDVRRGDLFDRLGLRPRDVIVLVDGERVSHERNPLWQALAERDRVTITVMRRGLPKTFRYVIE